MTALLHDKKNIFQFIEIQVTLEGGQIWTSFFFYEDRWRIQTTKARVFYLHLRDLCYIKTSGKVFFASHFSPQRTACRTWFCPYNHMKPRSWTRIFGLGDSLSLPEPSAGPWAILPAPILGFWKSFFEDLKGQFQKYGWIACLFMSQKNLRLRNEQIMFAPSWSCRQLWVTWCGAGNYLSNVLSTSSVVEPHTDPTWLTSINLLSPVTYWRKSFLYLWD